MLTDKPSEKPAGIDPVLKSQVAEAGKLAVRRGDWRSPVAWQSFRKKDLPPPPPQGDLEAVHWDFTVMAG